jgi:mannose-6-phosphate isomerase class I
MQVDCTAQTYAWGIKGENSLVAKFKKASDSSFVVEPDNTYAELWYIL